MDTKDQTTAPETGSDSPYRGADLVFIISQPKAGSTLLQRLLAGHPEIQTSAETWLMLHPLYGLRLTGIKADFNANWAATGVREFLDNYADGKETYHDGLRSFARTIYGHVLEKSGKKLFLDKTPRYTMIVDELYELFPEAKFIILLRNPLAVLNSELQTYVKGDWPVLSRFEPDLVAAPARINAAKRFLGTSAFEVRYEDLVSDPAVSIKNLCDFLNLDFDAEMLDYSNTPAPAGKMNDPVGIHRHTSASTSSMDKWKSLGEDGQLRAFALSYLEELGDEVISEFGYDASELRSAIEKTPVESSPRCVYPWSLAIKPEHTWSIRQQITSAYLMATQARGRLGGLLAVGKVLLSRLSGGAARLTSSSAKRKHQTGSTVR